MKISRDKGQAGEREVAAPLPEPSGGNVCRRVRHHDGDSDLTGVPGRCVEVLAALARGYDVTGGGDEMTDTFGAAGGTYHFRGGISW